MPADEADDLSDPRHPDFDLSEWAAASVASADPKPWFLRRWVLLVVAFFVISGLLLPFLIRI